MDACGGGTKAFFHGRVFYANPSDFDGGDTDGTWAFDMSGPLDRCGHDGLGHQSSHLSKVAMDGMFPSGP